MERNWDIIRDILIKIEALDSANKPLHLSDFPPDKANEYSYHAELLLEAGLVEGQMHRTMRQEAQTFMIRRLTWEGHEFLDTIRNDNVWSKTKKSFVKGGLSMTFDLVKGVATDVAAAFLKQTIGS